MAHFTREHAPTSPQRPGPAGSDPAPPGPATPAPPSEPRGCLFALSQPPLILFLAFIGALLFITGVYDWFVL